MDCECIEELGREGSCYHCPGACHPSKLPRALSKLAPLPLSVVSGPPFVQLPMPATTSCQSSNLRAIETIADWKATDSLELF